MAEIKGDYRKCQRYMLNVHMRKSYNANEYIRKSWKANKHQICPSPSTLQLSRRVLNCLQPPRAEKPPPPEFFSRSAACNSADSKCCNESFHPRLILPPALVQHHSLFPLKKNPFPSYWTIINCRWEKFIIFFPNQYIQILPVELAHWSLV